MKEYKYFLKKDMINASSILFNMKKQSFDIIIIEAYQDYSNTKLKSLNEKTIKKVFEDILVIINGSLNSVKNRIKRIIYSLEMEETNIPYNDMVVFRFLILGKSLSGLDYNLKQKLTPSVVNDIGGELSLNHITNQTFTDMMTELMPIRSLKTPNPPKNPSLRKYYTDDLYRLVMDTPKEYFFE
jgi:hypothetical protein